VGFSLSLSLCPDFFFEVGLRTNFQNPKQFLSTNEKNHHADVTYRTPNTPTGDGRRRRRKKKTAEEREKLRFRRSSSSLIALSVCKSNATQPRERQRNRHGERYLRSRNAFNKVVVK